MNKQSPGNQYTLDYFMRECDGYRQFANSRGKVLGKRLKKMLALADIRGGENILDVGCGRGELVLNGSSAGAVAWGIDTSPAAIEICRQARRTWERKNPKIKESSLFIQTAGTKLPFKENTFDIIWLSDIVEHLPPGTLAGVMNELRRISRKTARILIHTSPNRYYIPVGGRLMAFLYRTFRLLGIPPYRENRSIPWNIRKLLPAGLQKNIHVNEQSRGSLRRALKRSGFAIQKIWFEPNPHYLDLLFPDSRGLRIMGKIKKIIPCRHVFHADLYCTASPSPDSFSTQQREQTGKPDNL